MPFAVRMGPVEAEAAAGRGGRGPVRVLPDASDLADPSDLAEPGGSITATLVRRDNRWHLVEVGNVYP